MVRLILGLQFYFPNMIMLIDTHAHIHFSDFAHDPFESLTNDLDTIFENARAKDIGAIITIGTDEKDSQAALEFVNNDVVLQKAGSIQLFATVGLHPHEASHGQTALDSIRNLLQKNDKKVVAVGECGLDYFHNHSSREEQIVAMKAQLELAQEYKLALVFHVRDAWNDFFEIINDYHGARGVIHSFTGGPAELKQATKRGLYCAINGIVTFTKQEDQLLAARQIPADKLLLETDCPFLTPAPMRGKRNEPANVAIVADFLARQRQISLAALAATTTQNANQLFGLGI